MEADSSFKGFYMIKRIYGLNGCLGWIIHTNEQDQLHREDGPAIEYDNGAKAWYINGKRHREDGPAIILSNNQCEYWFDNKKYSKKEWNKILKLKAFV